MNDREYIECPYCGEDIKAKAIKCKHCKSEIINYTNRVENINNESVLTIGWIIGTLLLPIIGIIGWLYGIIKNRKGAWGLLSISILAWIFSALFIYPLFTSNNNQQLAGQKSIDAQLSSSEDEKNWVTIAEWQGEGMRSTETFITQTNEWRINWETYDELFEGASILQIYVYDANNNDLFIDLVANVQGESIASSYVRAAPGRYYLDISSANIKWNVVVEEKR